MSIYLFSPLLDTPGSGTLAGVDDFHHQLGNLMPNRNRTVNIQVLGRKASLAGVTANDELYVYAHGDYRTKRLFTKVDPENYITPNSLADLLELRALPDLQGLVVNLFACTSGVVGGDGRTMAYLLALNLHRVGYRQLKVRGFVGFVHLGGGFQMSTFEVSKQFGGDLVAAQGVASNAKAAMARGVVYNLNGTIHSGHEGRGVETHRGNETHFRIRNI